MVSTKIELAFNKVARTKDLDDLARLLFPGNRNHQRILVAIFVELKWSDDQFLPSLDWVAEKQGFTKRVLQTVRAKMRRMGIIDHVSRFNAKHGYREGWVFSRRFEKSLLALSETFASLRVKESEAGEAKDRDALRYL